MLLLLLRSRYVPPELRAGWIIAADQRLSAVVAAPRQFTVFAQPRDNTVRASL